MSASAGSTLTRGAPTNPPNRFERLEYVPDPEVPSEAGAARTELLRDRSRTIIAYNDSPDVGFNASINPYRGCEHGCVYCYARPTHEFLGFSAGLDFETKIVIKEGASILLRREMSSPRWKPQVLALSGVTDAYQPVERRLRLTRACLEVLAEFRNPVVVVTKNELVRRDIDLLQELAAHSCAAVFISVTTLDADLVRKMEPRTSLPARRLATIQALAQAGIPVGVMVAPVIPGLTDHEIPSILAAAAQSGARFAGYVMLRLPYAVAELFDSWLSKHMPERRGRVLGRIEEVRGGRRNDPRFGSRMRGQGPYADHVAALFRVGCRRAGLTRGGPKLAVEAFRRAGASQLRLIA